MGAYVGNTKIGQMYLGSTEIAQAYLGSTLVYEAGGGGGGTLPYDAEVEYLQASGTQWIYADCDPITKVEIDCQAETNFVKQSRYMSTISGNTGFNIYINGDTWYATSINSDWSSNRKVKCTTRAHITIDAEIKTTTIIADDVTYTWTTNKSPNYLRGFVLFAADSNGTQPLKGKIYSCKLYRSGTLAYDFIPVRVGQVGYLYDKVSRTLFGNAGTGDFILGNDVDN